MIETLWDIGVIHWYLAISYATMLLIINFGWRIEGDELSHGEERFFTFLIWLISPIVCPFVVIWKLLFNPLKELKLPQLFKRKEREDKQTYY